MEPIPFSVWLEKQYIAWLSAAGERRTQRQFAAWLGLSNALLSHYLRGSRSPSDEYLEKIAAKLGDEAYDILEQPRPDKLFRRLKFAWQKLTSDERIQLEDLVDRLEKR